MLTFVIVDGYAGNAQKSREGALRFGGAGTAAGNPGTDSPMSGQPPIAGMQTVDAAGLPIGDGHPARIMGVLNVSTESPYDPSVFDDPDDAAAYVDEELIGEGADIVDVGLESANKRFEVLSAEQELDRLATAIEAIERVDGDAVFSIETRYSEVADEALSRGFDMVNDICGFADPEMPAVCEAHDVAVAKMASPPDLGRPGAVETGDWAARSAAGSERSGSYADDIYDALTLNGFTDKTIVDPAFGGWSEAKTLADDRETFERLREFRGHGQPILVSINRKNFLRDVADRPTEEALPVSLAATSMAVERGAHVVRTHDVAETRDAALIGYEFRRDRPREGSVEELDVTTVREAQRHVDRLAPADETPGPDRLEQAAAGHATARAYEVTGLSASDREALSGEGIAVVGDDPAFVAGSAETLQTAARALESRDGVLGELATAWSRPGN
jgi:dihydropteroate synthase